MKYNFDKEIPVIAEADVLIVGGGPGGVSAGIMAARQGVDVLVVERYGCLGGMAAFGEVSPFMRNHVNGETLDKPVYVDICRKLWEKHPPAARLAFPFNEKVAAGAISKDEVILAMEELLLEAGAKILYHHTLVDVICVDKNIQAAIFHSKSGFAAIKAKTFIDSTGDGDLAVLAGCPFEIGNNDGFCQPMTTCFKLSGVNVKAMPPRIKISEIYNEARKAGKIDCPRENVLFFSYFESDIIHFNTTRVVKKSGVNGLDLSAAEMEGRRQVREFIDFLRNEIPGFENARLHSIAHHIGVRESRRILGLVYQTAQDFINAAKFPDGVVKANYTIDIHNPSGTGTTIMEMPLSDWYEIRYGALIPRECNNLLMGCRAISVDHELHSSCRVMPPVCSIGQAAGMAAAMCCQKNCLPAELKGEDVRKKLVQSGASL